MPRMAGLHQDCATDGERVVAFFGKGGLHCYSVEGKRLWSRDLGSFPGPWGVAASPIIVGDLVIQNCDAQGEGYLLALNKFDGKEVWKTPRTAPERGGWSTPVLMPAGDHQELVLNGERAVTAYDPRAANNSGLARALQAEATQPLLRKRPPLCREWAAGRHLRRQARRLRRRYQKNMAWHTERKGGRDLPAPILVGDYLTVANTGRHNHGLRKFIGQSFVVRALKGAIFVIADCCEWAGLLPE